MEKLQQRRDRKDRKHMKTLKLLRRQTTLDLKKTAMSNQNLTAKLKECIFLREVVM